MKIYTGISSKRVVEKEKIIDINYLKLRVNISMEDPRSFYNFITFQFISISGKGIRLQHGVKVNEYEFFKHVSTIKNNLNEKFL